MARESCFCSVKELQFRSVNFGVQNDITEAHSRLHSDHSHEKLVIHHLESIFACS